MRLNLKNHEVVGVLGLIGMFLIYHGAWFGLTVLAFFIWWNVPKDSDDVGGWSHGTATWASLKELISARFIGTNDGLILGRIAQYLVRLPMDLFVNAVVFGPPGCGKSILLIGNLLAGFKQCSIWCVDVKGELLRESGSWRRRSGCVIVLDPFGITGEESLRFNFLAFLDPESPELLDDLDAYANGIVVKEKTELDPMWTAWSSLLLSVFMLYVVLKAAAGVRNLQSVVELLSNPEYYQGVLTALQGETDVCGGMASRRAFQASRLVGKTLESVLATLFRHLSFLNSPNLKEYMSCTAEDAFDPRWLLESKVSVYFVMPAVYLKSHAAVTRLHVTSIALAFLRAREARSQKCVLLLDEVAQLGQMEILDTVCTLGRGFGLLVWLFFQSKGQVHDVFPDNKAITFNSAMDARVYFKPNDYETAEEISKSLGETTICTRTINSGESSNRGYTEGAHPSHNAGTSNNSGASIQETGRKLLMPDEILRLDPDLQIVITRHTSPILCGKVRYFADQEFGEMRGEMPVVEVRERSWLDWLFAR